MSAWHVSDVFEHRHRERVRLLEYHADAGSQRDRIDAGTIDVHTVDDDFSPNPGARDRIVHPVETTQECRLAAARWTNERHHSPFENLDRDALERVLLAIVNVHVFRAHLDGGADWRPFAVQCEIHLSVHT